MVDGVVQVFDGEGGSSNLFPVPGNATEFFTDMHRWVEGGWVGCILQHVPLSKRATCSCV